MNKDLIVKKSKIDKKGAFAARDFKKGEVVLKWNPKILTKAEVGKLPSGKRHYLYRAGKNKYFFMQSPEKYLNHSCKPNTRIKNYCDVATRDIKKGEEITSDYTQNKGDLSVSFKCNCGSKNCKGMI